MKKQYLTAKELAFVLENSVSNAYLRIKQMNEELQAKGYQTLPGKIPVAYAKEKFYGIDFDSVES